MKPAIVVGSAPCYWQDLRNAKKAYPNAFVLVINGACVVVEEADAMLSGHITNVEKYVKTRTEQFPNRNIEVWGACSTKRLIDYRANHPVVTKWFSNSTATGATSAGKAARMLMQEGFEPVILCGCPMDSSGYFPGEEDKNYIRHNCARVGDPAQRMHSSIEKYRDKMAMLAKDEFAGRVFSMSGYTREVLGAPPGVEA